VGKYTLSSAKLVTTVSNFTAEECMKKGIPSWKIRVIENGIDLDRYKPVSYGELEERFHVGEEDILILSISRVTWYKGFEYALKAVKRVIEQTGKSVKYMVIGSLENQSYYFNLRKMVKELGLLGNVVFTGFLPHDMKLQALTRADVFLAPSLHEGFGLVILEAMAMGKPIIASDCEGFRCILEHMRTGYIVKPGDSEEIARAVCLLIDDPSLASELSKNALLHVGKYDWKRIVKEYVEAYKLVIEQ
jgi:glycosyltransferase involved in cell wall biosynthesis